MEDFNNFREAAFICITDCIHGLETSTMTVDLVVTRLESVLLSTFEYVHVANVELHLIVQGLEEVIFILSTTLPDARQLPAQRGRITIPMDMHAVEGLLAMNFKATKIAEMFGVSIRTLHRRFKENGISVRGSYSTITRTQLGATVTDILRNFPNTGYKRMRGFLLERRVKVPELQVREVMRAVDPQGVFQRTRENRAIFRRIYFIKYSNQLWHMDANLKLIRWKIVVRGGIDGKSRNCTYLNAGGDNTSTSTLKAFVEGVQRYGVPYRCRGDKGGENVLVARFMLEHRGTNRSSFISGRSVHNQRIERFWRDVFYGCLSFYKVVFCKLEEEGLLDINNDNHLFVLHYVYLPRLNHHLQTFMDGWNNHPLSSEHNMTPQQLMVQHLPPEFYDMRVSEDECGLLDFPINNETDLQHFETHNEITNPSALRFSITDDQLNQLGEINPLGLSDDFGCRIFMDAIECLN